MADFKGQLMTIEKTVGEKKIEKVKLEERQRKLTEERTEIQKQIEDLGIPSGEVEAWLAKEETEIKEGIGKCNGILNLN